MIHPFFNGGPGPLDLGFNIAVKVMANRCCPAGFNVTDDESRAPSTLEELTAYVSRTGRILVWTGASDNTIYRDPEVNWHARAWHDWWHWHLQAPFTPEGEAAVAKAQIAHLFAVYGKNATSEYWARILDIEVNGQIAYEQQHGEFPIDQFAFTLAALAGQPYAEVRA